MIIGTAGHVDHGKSALIEALTGQPMDRLVDEKRRGITIDLNFAALDVGLAHPAGIIDVPGHEDFIRNMVAGAAGIDLLLLVVAADESIMPQTREHLAIAEQLGIPRGVPVITKQDLVEPEWAEMVALEVADWLAGSPIRFTSPVPVSALRGEGLDRLREAIRDAAASTPSRSSGDTFRMPVDRVFSIAGIGTVATGTAWSGSVKVGDLVRIMPSGLPGRVRSVEMHGAKLERSLPGARTAVGLAGLTREEVRRGHILVSPDSAWTAVRALDVEVRLLAHAPRPLSNRSRIRLHLGTAEVMARVIPVRSIPPGGSGMARLTLEEPIAARGGDRFVLRSFSPVTTIGGGVVVDPLPPVRKVSWPTQLGAADPGLRLAGLLERRRDGVATAELPILLGISAPDAERVLSLLPSLVQIGAHWVSRHRVAEVAEQALELTRRHQSSHPADTGMPLETLRRSIRAATWVTDAALQDLASERRLTAVDGLVRTPEFRPRVTGGHAEVDRVVAAVTRAGLTPPTLAELETLTGRGDVGAALRIAAGQGRVVAVERDRYYSVESLEVFASAVRTFGGEQEITPAGLRERLGLSRKFLIPLLEWADATGLTIRTGDSRRLRG